MAAAARQVPQSLYTDGPDLGEYGAAVTGHDSGGDGA
jgi:hypothetical protein